MATHASLTARLKGPIRAAAAKLTHSPRLILSICPRVLPESPRGPLRKAVAGDADTSPGRTRSPLPRPCPFPSAGPLWCGGGSSGSQARTVSLWQGRLLCRTARPLERSQQPRQHREGAASCFLPAALPRAPASPGSWLPGCSPALGFTLRLGRWGWEETHPVGLPHASSCFSVSLSVHVLLLLPSKQSLHTEDSRWEFQSPDQSLSPLCSGRHRPAAPLSPSARLGLWGSQACSGGSTLPGFKSRPCCVALASS